MAEIRCGAYGHLSIGGNRYNRSVCEGYLKLRIEGYFIRGSYGIRIRSYHARIKHEFAHCFPGSGSAGARVGIASCVWGDVVRENIIICAYVPTTHRGAREAIFVGIKICDIERGKVGAFRDCRRS